MRRFSLRIQFCLAAAIGIGLAFCSDQVYMLLAVRTDVVHDWEVAIAFVYPGILACAAIASGLLLRLMAAHTWAWLMSFVATPALYISLLFVIVDAMQGHLADSFWPLFAVVVVLTWPITYFAFRIRSRTRSPDPDAPPTCPKCEYNLTGNVSGICPECGTPIATQSPQPSRT